MNRQLQASVRNQTVAIWRSPSCPALFGVNHRPFLYLPTQCRAYSRLDPRSITDRESLLVSSLRAEKLLTTDLINLAGITKTGVRFNLVDRRLRLSYHSDCRNNLRKQYTPFPPHACGYLYYHPGPPHAPLAGSIRLRVPSSDGLGRDLRLPNGLPWRILLPQLAGFEQGTGAVRRLLADELVSPALIAHCERMFASRHRLVPENFQFYLGQPFALSMEQAQLRLVIVGRDRLASFSKQRLFGDPAGRYPFTGKLLARFELSADRARCFMRIVRVVEPVTCVVPGYTGRIVAPTVGGYLSYNMHKKEVPWSLDLTRSSVAADAIRLLLPQS